jgi:hypothetical protein
LVRALTNTLHGQTRASEIVDPFSGVGTLGIECALLGIASKSYDLNPFFVEVARAKYRALTLTKSDVAQLDTLRDYAQGLRAAGPEDNTEQPSLFDESASQVTITIPKPLARRVKQQGLVLVQQLRGKIEEVCSDQAKHVANLALAYYANSMLKKYAFDKILRCFWAHLSRIMYLDRFMKRLYSDMIIATPESATFAEGNIKTLSQRESGLGAVITSPPYTTAIDYIGNDVMAYYTLGLNGHHTIEEEMIGSTRLGRLSSDQTREWSRFVPRPVKKAHRSIHEMNPKKALCLAKYFQDMHRAFEQLTSSLAIGGKMAMVVCGQQQFGSSKARVTYNVADAITEIGTDGGLTLDRRIDIDLTKNGDGDITQEAVLLFSRDH